MREFAIKALIAGIVCFCGIAGGIYFGMTASGLGAFQMMPEALPNTSYLSVDDVFPDFDLLEAGAQIPVTVSELASESPTLLVFVSASCGACEQMAAFWRKRTVHELEDSIQIALVYDENDLPNPHGELLDIPGARVFSADRASHAAEDGILSTPTFVGLDRSSRVLFVHSGFTPKLDGKVLNALM